jgi:hypothetical protein
MDEICADFIFVISIDLIHLSWSLSGDAIIFVVSPEQHMMWCLNILVREVDMKNVGVGRLLMVKSYVLSDSQVAKPLAEAMFEML